MGVLTVFMAFKEKNYIVFAHEKDKAGMVRRSCRHCMCKVFLKGKSIVLLTSEIVLIRI